MQKRTTRMLTKAKLALSLVMLSSMSAQAENMSFNTLLQDVIDHYPAIKTAYYQVAKARQDNIKIEGQLGWQLSAQTGLAQEVSFAGIPVDQTNLGGNLRRKLESGDSLSFSAGLSQESYDTGSSSSSDLRFEYTKPLGKGAGNIDYKTSLSSAKSSVDIKTASQRLLLDNTAKQVIELYTAAINTKQRINTTKASIKRTIKLSRFINDRLKLGIVEDKDQLQTDAQLHSQKAQLTALQLAWTQQLIAINRLKGSHWNNELNLSIPDLKHDEKKSFKNQFSLASSHSPALAQSNSLIKLADNQITIQRQNHKNNLDLKLFVGNKTLDGNNLFGQDVNNSDVIAGVQFAFSQNMDKSADNAALYQAQLERGLQLQNKKQLLEDLHYDLASLLAEAAAVTQSIKAYQLSKKAELKKLKDAEKRYRSGRIDIDQLLQFENQLSATELTLNLQKMELQKRLLNLSLLKGQLWKSIKLPDYDFTNLDLKSDDKIIGDAL